MNHQRQFLLGAFFITALGILAAYTLFLTDTVSLFGDPILVRVYFPEAYDLRPGDPVQAAGLRIGRVKELTTNFNGPREQRILATLSLDEEIELLEDFSIEIRETTLLGGRHVYIEPGTYGGPPHDRTGDLMGAIQKNPLEALSDLGGMFADNRGDVRTIVSDFANITTSLREGKGTLGQLLVDDAMAKKVNTSLDNIAGVTERINNGKGVIGMLLNDDTVAADVRGVVDNLVTIAADIRGGKGVVGELIYDQDLANEIRLGLESLSRVAQDIGNGQGVVGQLLSDDELSGKLESIVTNFQSASADIERIASRIRTGKGTVGKLLMDQELYDEAIIAVKLLTRTLEDYREAAPVSAFTSVLFSAF